MLPHVYHDVKLNWTLKRPKYLGTAVIRDITGVSPWGVRKGGDKATAHLVGMLRSQRAKSLGKL